MDHGAGVRFARGELVVVLDDGLDPSPAVLAASASAITPGRMAEMVRYTSGFVSVALPALRCNDLLLPCLAHDPFSMLRPVVAVSVDARVGVSTGISAADRCRTAHVLADPNSIASDLCRPGHVIVLRVPMDAPRGADTGSRQIFAAMDLCASTGRAPAVVTSVLVGDAGSTLTNAEASEFAAARGYAIVRASSVVAAASHERSLQRAAS